MLNVVRIWVLFSTLLVAAGWILSALHQLNPAGYGIVFALAVIAFFFWQQRTKWRPNIDSARSFHKFRRRCRRIAPLIFLTLVLMTLLAGVMYAPSNGSSTGYRIPRVLHWLAAGQWHWIRSMDVRINIAGCEFEWLFAPLILLTHSDRLLFLVNWLPFLLLPGLIFSVFTRLGVRPRVAWWWMWLLPSGWCFIMQAASTLNDACGTAYALAAVDFALRARQNKKIGELWLALLATALATGVKQTYVLLAIPGLIAIWPSVQLLLKRPLRSLALTALCLLVSALPMMVFDWQHTGSWSGVTDTDKSWKTTELHSPVWGIIGNVFYLTVQNLKPPVFPFVNSWNATMHHFLETALGAHFRQFEDFGLLSFGVGESTASLGAGISLLILASIIAARQRRQKAIAGPPESAQLLLRVLRWIPWAMLLLFMAKVGNGGNGRLLAAYYIFLFPALLISPGHSVLVQRRWWQRAARLVLLLAVMLVVISRDRPLFPSQTVIGWLGSKYPNSKLVSNIAKTYSEAPAFAENLQFLRDNLPPDEPVLGFATGTGEVESLLWLPYGSRRVQRIMPEDTPEQLRSWGIRYVVVNPQFLVWNKETLEEWISRYKGIIVKQWEFIEDPYAPPVRSYLVRLPSS